MLFLSACSNELNRKEDEILYINNASDTPYIRNGPVSGYLIDDIYIITISENTSITKWVEYSQEREYYRSQNINPISSCDIQRFINVNLNTVIKEIGPPHTDIGSGFYIPTYLTEDAYLINFHLINEKIYMITRQDLLTGNKETICVGQAT